MYICWSVFQVAWALGKGMKDANYKEYWDVERGVSYIPWEELPSSGNYDIISEGAMIDDDTLPPEVREG